MSHKHTTLRDTLGAGLCGGKLRGKGANVHFAPLGPPLLAVVHRVDADIVSAPQPTYATCM